MKFSVWFVWQWCARKLINHIFVQFAPADRVILEDGLVLYDLWKFLFLYQLKLTYDIFMVLIKSHSYIHICDLKNGL